MFLFIASSHLNDVIVLASLDSFVFGSLFPYQLTNSELVIEVCGSLSTKKNTTKGKGICHVGICLEHY